MAGLAARWHVGLVGWGLDLKPGPTRLASVAFL